MQIDALKQDADLQEKLRENIDVIADQLFQLTLQPQWLR